MLWRSRVIAAKTAFSRAAHSAGGIDAAAAFAFCRDSVRQSDHENYLCSLLLPSSRVNSAFAIRAFNVEVAKIWDTTKETGIAKMRFQFWRETLAALQQNGPGKNTSSAVPSQPVAKALSVVIPAHKLSAGFLRRLVDVREQMLPNAAFSTVEELERYGEATQATLLYLLLEAAGVRSVHADHAASHLGKAIAITLQLRGIPHHAVHRRVLLPATLTAHFKTSHQDFFSGQSTPAMKEVVFELASTAHAHMLATKNHLQNQPAIIRQVLLPSVACARYLERLRQCDFDAFSPELQRRDSTLAFALLKERAAMSLPALAAR